MVNGLALTATNPDTHIPRKLTRQSKGLSMSILRQGCQDDKQDIWDWECSCDQGMAGEAWFTNTYRGGKKLAALLEPHVTFDDPDGRQERSLIRHQLAGWPGPCGCCPGSAMPERVRLGDRPGPPPMSAQIKSLCERGQPQVPHVDKCGLAGAQPEGGINLET